MAGEPIAFFPRGRPSIHALIRAGYLREATERVFEGAAAEHGIPIHILTEAAFRALLRHPAGREALLHHTRGREAGGSDA